MPLNPFANINIIRVNGGKNITTASLPQYSKQLDGTQLAYIDGCDSACCDLDLWPFDLISMSQAQVHVHAWPNFRKSAQIFTKVLYHGFYGSLPAVTLTFELLAPKANQHIYEPKYIRDQDWVKFPSLTFEIWCSQSFRVTACCYLNLWLVYLISISQAHVHASPNFGEMSSNNYKVIPFNLLSRSLLAVTLTLELLTPKANRHIY